jgi:hypothetical protein
MSLLNYTSEEHEPVMGSTLIEHGPRMKLGLSCDEYCIVKMLIYCIEKKRSFDFDRIKRHLGFEESHIILLLDMLQEKNIIKIDTKGNKITKRWRELHEKQNHTSFDEFWETYKGIKWPGSKKLAMEKFIITATKWGSRYIISRKKAYIDFLLKPENRWRKIMNATTFLNVTNENFNQPWEDYGETTTASTQMKGKLLSKEEKEKLFEE